MATDIGFKRKPLKEVPKIIIDMVSDSLANSNGNPLTSSELYKYRIETLLCDMRMKMPWEKLVLTLTEEQISNFITYCAGIIPYRWSRFSKEESSEVAELILPIDTDEDSEKSYFFQARRPPESVRKESIKNIEKLGVEIEDILKRYPTIMKEILQMDSSLLDFVNALPTFNKVTAKIGNMSRADLHETTALTMPTKTSSNAESRHFYRELSLLFESFTDKPHNELVADITNIIFDLDGEHEVTGDDVKKANQQMKKKGKIKVE